MDRNLSSFKNDNCYINQYNNNNTMPLNYMLYNGKYENSTILCSNNNMCNTENNWTTIGDRTDVDSYLKNVSLYSSKCAINKNLPCDLINNQSSDIKRLQVEKKFSNGLCDKVPVVNNPYLYERKLNPSNLSK